ncbi:PREDICTED: peroxisomal membrane protein PEX14 isoform X2 [Nelumbo nucifera]|uniref:Peroxisomal membrane protein PEX14 n=1 Tax=Nelumbo nucifera TaxID=4432 RepID=A0A1U7Z7Y9_NELNU|nr:PREDICTED: peroxisomal membrane protein PEX14 isoform X2 [Nelumbo nucifera]
MGSESTTAPNLRDEKPQNPAMDVNGQVAEGDSTKEIPTKSVFVNSEPMREEQVQNAVKFLSHPKVRGSPVIYRRSFLEKKGLTKEEIDEAFRRVPDPPPTVTNVQATATSQDSQLKPSTNLQTQIQGQAPQPAAVPSGAASALATLPRTKFHWSHALLAIGFLAVSGAGSAIVFKNAVVPRLKSWIRKVVLEEEDESVKRNLSKPSLAEEAAAAAKAAAAAAADVARASQEMLNSKNEEKKYFETFMSVLDVQVAEMKSMSNAIRKLEAKGEQHSQSVSRNGPSNTSWSASHASQEDSRGFMEGFKQAKVNGTVDFDSGSGRPMSAPASMEPSVAPHPKSYMEIMAMVQRGEKPPGIKEINDLPPNPNQPPSNPRLAPRMKPWEVGQAQNSSSYTLQSQTSGENSSYKVEDNGSASQLNGYSSEPWWQRKNVRISEIEDENDQRIASYGIVPVANERPVQRTWVPPQPPPVSMPEAAAAIRQPKSIIQKEQPSNDQVMERSSDEVDELQRITKLSELGGEVDLNNSGKNLEISEIQEEQSGIEGN